jgi:hypothetical protein
MVVMFLSGYLVACRVPWNINRLEPPFLNQGLDVPVHRRNSERWMAMLRRSQRLFGRERPIRLSKRVANRSSLPRVSSVPAVQFSPLLAD